MLPKLPSILIEAGEWMTSVMQALLEDILNFFCSFVIYFVIYFVIFFVIYFVHKFDLLEDLLINITTTNHNDNQPILRNAMPPCHGTRGSGGVTV